MEIPEIGRFVSVKPGLNCERREVKNSQNLYAVGLRKYDTTVGHALRVISCICTLFLIRHGDVIGPL